MYLTDSIADVTLGQASLYAVLGYAVVFFGLILLMLVVILVGKIFTAGAKKETVPEPAPAPAEEIPAPGTAGQLKLHDVEPKTAAMLMAIVADKLGRPINELRFISIQEVTK